jgi:PKD repeat protein
MQNPTHTYLAVGTYTVTLTTSDGNCTNSWTETVVIDRVTSIENPFAEAGFQLYPNPGNGTFWLERKEASQEMTISVWNMLGQEVSRQIFPAGSFRQQVTTRNNATGTYLIRLQQADRVWVQKYILNQ